MPRWNNPICAGSSDFFVRRRAILNSGNNRLELNKCQDQTVGTSQLELINVKWAREYVSFSVDRWILMLIGGFIGVAGCSRPSLELDAPRRASPSPSAVFLAVDAGEPPSELTESTTLEEKGKSLLFQRWSGELAKCAPLPLRPVQIDLTFKVVQNGRIATTGLACTGGKEFVCSCVSRVLAGKDFPADFSGRTNMRMRFDKLP